MTTYRTGNAIGSADPRDLYDNSENLDELVNSQDKTEHNDRLGVPRKTWHGMEEEFDGDQARRENEHGADQTRREDEFDADQTRRESEFVDAQADKQQRFNLLLANSGYEYLADYAGGIELTEYNQVLRDGSGNLWRVSAATDLPYTTDGTGLPEGGAFVAVGDADIRNDLAAGVGAGKGGLLVRGSVIYVNTIDDLKALQTSELVDGQQVSMPDGTRTWDSVSQQWRSDRHSSAPTAVYAHDAIWSWWAKPCFLRHTSARSDKSYMAISQSDGAVGFQVHDHLTREQKQYIVTRDTNPDDHNTGAVVAGDGRVAVFFPTRTWAGESGGKYVEFAEEGEPDLTVHDLNMGGDYPNAYNMDGQLFVMTRGWNYRINTWPMTDWLSAASTFFTGDSPYIATSRSKADYSVINFAVGWHPSASANSNIYYGEIHRHGTQGDWDVVVNGTAVANLVTRQNMPLTDADLELVYEAGANETTRLFHVADNVVVFAVWTVGETDTAMYKYAIKEGGAWVARDIMPAGVPFESSPHTLYYGGVAVDYDDSSIVYVSTSEGEYQRWRCLKLSTPDSGATWVEVDKWYAGNEGSGAVIARPMIELPSENTAKLGITDMRCAAFNGLYDNVNYQRFYTAIQTLSPGYRDDSATGMGVTLASSSSKSSGNRSIVAASRNSSATDAFSGVIASDGSNCHGRAAAVIASTNSNIPVKDTTNRLGSLIAASSGCSVGEASAYNGILASSNSSVEGVRDTVISSAGCTASSGATTNAMSSIIASSNCETLAYRSVILGSAASSTTARSAFIAASLSSNVTGTYASSISSEGADVRSPNSTSIASTDGVVSVATCGSLLSTQTCTVGGQRAGVAYSRDSHASSGYSAVLASRGTRSTQGWSIAGGYSTDETPATANRTWQIRSENGSIAISGSLSEGTNFSDIAKLIANGEGSEIGPGYLLTLIGEKVYKAQAGERVDAIVAATPGIIQNDTPFTWQGRYLLDEWGRQVRESVAHVRWGEFDGPLDQAPGDIPDEAEYYTMELPVENPEYDPGQENVPRSERPDEWVLAGVHGIIRTRVDGSVTQAAVDAAEATRDVLFVEAGEVPGIGRLAQGATNVQVMAVEKEFDGDYGIARCLLR